MKIDELIGHEVNVILTNAHIHVRVEGILKYFSGRYYVYNDDRHISFYSWSVVKVDTDQAFVFLGT